MIDIEKLAKEASIHVNSGRLTIEFMGVSEEVWLPPSPALAIGMIQALVKEVHTRVEKKLETVEKVCTTER